jgi:Protein of unknown function (DUF3631)
MDEADRVVDEAFQWVRNQSKGRNTRKTTNGQAEVGPPALLLDEIRAFLGRFIIYPSAHAHDAHVLWIAHTHMMDAWESTPRLAFLSPEPASGKTRALEVSELLVPNPVEAVNVSPAYLFRKVGDDGAKPTILFDEIDTVFGPKAKENEEIRGLLNAGHRRGAVTGRCVARGNAVTCEDIPAFCAVALAGLGWLPDTLMSRSVILRMRRRKPGERIEPFRRRNSLPLGQALRNRLAQWAATAVQDLAEARPDMPPGVEDRAADCWESLVAIADAAGGDWPKRAREAAVALVAAAADEEPSLGIRLLSDLREVFGGAEQMTTVAILDALHGLKEAPWSDLKGKPLNDRGLATRLRQYGVKSKSLNTGGEHRPKGYTRFDLYDAWERYLLPSADRSATSATGATEPDFQGSAVAAVAADGANVADDEDAESADETSTVAAVAAVAAVAGNGGGVPSDIAAVFEELAAQAAPVPQRGCGYCGRLGTPEKPLRLASDGVRMAYLHRACEVRWAEGLTLGSSVH